MSDSSGRVKHRLSKSRFVTGLKCHKCLWWQTHEPDAPELEPDAATLDKFEQGRQVGDLARTYVPGGELIDLPHYAVRDRVAATNDALKRGLPAIYEASFLADDVFVLVDVLEKASRGHNLIEVKSTNSAKEHHVPDAATQAHVLRKLGLDVRRVEIMHLNRECRHPDLSNLFVRTDVTREVEATLPDLPREIRAQLAMLKGPLPDVAIGDHCNEPYECPFLGRCWPDFPRHHVRTLYGIGKKLAQYEEAGYTTIHDIPKTARLSKIQERQRKAVLRNRLIVEPGLREALGRPEPPMAFLDFETVSRAIPCWPGCAPWEAVPAQFSCHVEAGDGTITHHEWLAEGPGDPRPAVAEHLIAACEGASMIWAYSAGFERRCITRMAGALPALSKPLRDIEARLADLAAVVRDRVYHPDFNGSFSLKSVLPALVPELGYEDLEITEGTDASLQLARLMFKAGEISSAERERVRRELLEYCGRDTWALVRLVGELKRLAQSQGRGIDSG